MVSALLQAEGIDVNRAKKNGCDSSVHCLLLWPSGLLLLSTGNHLDVVRMDVVRMC